MSIRRLEGALQAGKSIQFTTITPYKEHSYDEARGGVYSLRYSEGSRWIAAGYQDGSIELISSMTGDFREIRRHRYGSMAITCLRWHPKTSFLCYATSADGKVIYCNSTDYTTSEIINEPNNEINSIDFSMSGEKFVTGGKDLDIRMYDAETNQQIRTFAGYHYDSDEAGHQGHAQRIFAIKYHPEIENVFVSAGWDNCLKIWDAREKNEVKASIPGPHICGDALDIKGHHILTGSWRHSNALQLWHFSHRELVQTIPFPCAQEQGQYIYSARFCDRDTVWAGGSGTNSARAIYFPTGEMIGEMKLDHPVQSVDYTSGGHMVVVSGGGTKLKTAKLS